MKKKKKSAKITNSMIFEVLYFDQKLSKPNCNEIYLYPQNIMM